VSRKPKIRFRHNMAIVGAGVIGFASAAPFALARWYFSPLLLVPILVVLWAWRSGVDVDTDGVTVRALVKSKRLAWDDIVGFTTDRTSVTAQLRDHTSVRLTAVTPADLPRLLRAGGQSLDATDD